MPEFLADDLDIQGRRLWKYSMPFFFSIYVPFKSFIYKLHFISFIFFLYIGVRVIIFEFIVMCSQPLC